MDIDINQLHENFCFYKNPEYPSQKLKIVHTFSDRRTILQTVSDNLQNCFTEKCKQTMRDAKS